MMRIRFGYENTQLTEKYIGKDDPCEHLARWKKYWGEEPQPKWVNIFYHTLDTIPMNGYLKIELRQGTTEWDVLKERFLLSFSFEEGFRCIAKALQEIKATIFKMSEEPVTWVQRDWST